MNFSTMKIGQKLFASFMFMALLILIVGGLGYYTQKQEQGAKHQVYEHGMLESDKLTTVQINFEMQRQLLTMILLTSEKTEEDQYKKEYYSMSDKNTDLLKSFKNEFNSDSVSSHFKDIDDLRNERHSLREEFFKLVTDMKKKEASEILFKKLKPLDDKYSTFLERINAQLTAESKKIILKSQKDGENASMVGLFVIAISLCFVLFISKILTKDIRDSLSICVDVMKKLAENDMTVKTKITNRHDEIGVLAQAIDKFVDNISGALTDVKKASKDLAKDSDVVEKNSNIIADGTQQQSASFEELSSSVQSNAANAETVAKTIAVVSQEAEAVGAKMHSTIESMNVIETTSQQISEAVTLITELADQTNLLALNAAIEAARAGDHGRGFAVVADEVRKLAERSAGSAKTITTIISDNLQQVEAGVMLAREAGDSLTKMLSEFNNINTQIHSISTSTQEQAASMEENSSITESNATAAESLSQSASQVATEASKLNVIVEKFKITG